MNKLKVFKLILGIGCVLILIQGSFWAYLLFFGGRPLRGFTVFIEQFVAQSEMVLIGIYISATIILLKLLASKRINHPKKYYAIAVIGCIIVGLNSMTLIVTPYTIVAADIEFDQEFGPDWESNIPEDIRDYFLQTPYLLPANYLVFPEKPVRIVKDVLYYEGEGVTLHFDVYTPIGEASQLPGRGSIIINMHAGAWISGGKGTWNMIQMSKYLAAQGYVVFDVEYGLIAGDLSNYSIPEAPETPEYVKGDFTIEDQVRHIGIFTKKLASKYAWAYSGNINSVYLMGRSAGAHLAGVIGFGYNEDYFQGLFSDKLTIKGIIPLYPPSGAPSIFLEGNPSNTSVLYNSYKIAYLADRNDPPMLIFQGTSDSQVWIERVETLESEIAAKGAKCCLLKFPLAGHANDFVFNSNIGQVWAYYLERFLYITQ